MARNIHVTVAALALEDERFLLVAERIDGRSVVNQPTGHWEPDETLQEAVVRETREETGWQFLPRGLVGIYQWERPDGRDTFLRFVFHGDATNGPPSPKLDPEIEQVLWWTETEIRSTTMPLRSPMVLRCIEDYQAGIRYDLECLSHIPPAGN